MCSLSRHAGELFGETVPFAIAACSYKILSSTPLHWPKNIFQWWVYLGAGHRASAKVCLKCIPFASTC